MTATRRARLDLEIVERGLVDTRSKARAMILAGDILVNGVAQLHAGTSVSESDQLELKAKARFVSRGGDKLQHALDSFGIVVENTICADLGASTGGFTDCLLQNGATRVYAVDVGYGQIDQSLRDDERVIVQERVNARYLESLPEPVQMVSIDVSFISLNLILPIAFKLLTDFGVCVPLIKPQFEAGRKDVGRGGVVRNPAVHRRVLEEVLTFASATGFHVAGLVRSPLLGPSGNIEFLAHLVRSESPLPRVDVASLIDSVLEPA